MYDTKKADYTEYDEIVKISRDIILKKDKYHIKGLKQLEKKINEIDDKTEKNLTVESQDIIRDSVLEISEAIKEVELYSKYPTSFGYFVVPFLVNDYKSLKKQFESVSYDNCECKTDANDFQYLFSHIKRIFTENDYYEINVNNILDKLNGRTVAFRGENITLDKLNENIIFPEDMKNKAVLQQASVYIIEKSEGFLLFKINYENMTNSEILRFTYNFSRIGRSVENPASYKATTLFSLVVAEILGVEDYKLLSNNNRDLSTPFYYISQRDNFICPVLQLVKRDFADVTDSEFRKFCYSLGRGYINTEGFSEERIKNSGEIDMIFEPTESINWFGNQRNLVCVCDSSVKNDSQSKYISNNVCQNYLYLYLTLLNQRFTLLTYMTQLVEFKNEQKKLIEINEKLARFRLIESFKIVSDEYTPQTIYSNMYRILDIDDLMNDINEISLKVKEQKGRNIENLFKWFTIISALATFYKIFDVLCPFIINSLKSPKITWLRELLNIQISSEPVSNEMLSVQLVSIILCLLVTAVFYIGFIKLPDFISKRK